MRAGRKTPRERLHAMRMPPGGAAAIAPGVARIVQNASRIISNGSRMA